MVTQLRCSAAPEILRMRDSALFYLDMLIETPDGRWLVARQVRERANPMFWITAFLALVALATLKIR